MPENIREAFSQYILNLQNNICRALENLDGKAFFAEDTWDRPEGGGGISRIISKGNVIEKGGVNTSMVHGELPLSMQQAFGVGESRFFACGLSLVLHPWNPFVPTVHANWRYLSCTIRKGTSLTAGLAGDLILPPIIYLKKTAVIFIPR
jgi:coproporphyrinogen III oxidase